MNWKIRKNKGITLIALVVTIVVLLILAGTSIAMLTGENGLIRKAQDAKLETRGAAVQEAKELWKSSKMVDKEFSTQTAQTLDELLDDLEEQNLITPKEKTDIKNNGEVTIGTTTIDFSNKIEFYLIAGGSNGVVNIKYTVPEGTTMEQFILENNPKDMDGYELFDNIRDGKVYTCEDWWDWFDGEEGAIMIGGGGPMYRNNSSESAMDYNNPGTVFVLPQDEIIEGAYYNCIR